MEQHPEKLRWRSTAVGGLSASQFGSALGYCGRVSDYVTYQREHVGTILEFTGNAATEHGCRTESKARCCYCLATGLAVLNGGFFTSVDRELACSPDGIIVVPGTPPQEQAKRPIRLLEIKSPYRALFDGSKDSNKPHGIPIQYMCQMQGQMCLSGAKECDFHIYLDGPQDCQLMCWRVYRDDRFWAWCEPKLRQVSSWIAHGLPPGIDRSFEFEGYDFSTLPVEPLLPPFSITTQRVTIDPRRYPFFFGKHKRPQPVATPPLPLPSSFPQKQPRVTLLRRSSSAASSVPPQVSPTSLLAKPPTSTPPAASPPPCGCGYCSSLGALKSPAAQILFATSLSRALVFVSHDNDRSDASSTSLLAPHNSPAISLEGAVVVFDGRKCLLETVDWDANSITLRPLHDGPPVTVNFSDQERMMKLSAVTTLPIDRSPPMSAPTGGHPTTALSFTTAAALVSAVPSGNAPSPTSTLTTASSMPSPPAPSPSPPPVPARSISSSHEGIRLLMRLIQTGQIREVTVGPSISRMLLMPSPTLGPLAFYLNRSDAAVTASADGLSQCSGSQGSSSPSRRQHHPDTTTLVCCPLDTFRQLVDLSEGRDPSTAVVVSDEDCSPLARNESSSSLLGASLSSSGTLSAADLSQRVRESLIQRRQASKIKARSFPKPMSVDESSMDPAVAAVGRSLASRDTRLVYCVVSLTEPTEDLRRRWISTAAPHVMHVRMSWPVFYRSLCNELQVGAEGVDGIRGGAKPLDRHRV